MKARSIVAMTSLSAAAITALGLTLFQLSQRGEPDVDPFVSASIPARSAQDFRDRIAYSAASGNRHTACRLERGAIETGRSRALRAAADCEAVWPGLARVRNWTENGDGTVTLSDAHGRELLVLDTSGDTDLEAVDPDAAAVKLTRLR